MITQGTGKSAVRAPLDEALEGEIRQLDLTLARMWQVLAASLVVAGLAVHLFMAVPAGLAVASISLLGGAWFSLQRVWLRRPSARFAVVANGVVEGLLPSAFLLAIAVTQGPAFALGSYVPPLIFAAMTVAATARLRPKMTLLIGVMHAALFLVVYAVFLRPRLTAAEMALPLLAPRLQVTRALSFVLGGTIAFGVCHALRRAIGRAERSVRSRDLFGKYRLAEKLGAGGMGVVHRAVYCPEGGFERTVAVKLLHAHLAEQRSFIDAFRAEAELSARLVHPNIVQVLDFGRFGEAYFLAMEHVEGSTLGWLMRRLAAAQRVAPLTAVGWIGQQILGGLAHSHNGARDAAGAVLHVVHRDLCPANVLVSASGDVKISDFGVAKALGDATFSETKTVVGHLGYMSPEQVCADPIDERCDLFAAAVILFELVAGAPLFRRANEALTLMALMHRDVPRVATLRAELSPEWDTFFERALAERPGGRFASAEEMAAALEELTGPSAAGREQLAELLAWAQETKPVDEPEAPASETKPTVALTGKSGTVRLSPSAAGGSQRPPSG